MIVATATNTPSPSPSRLREGNIRTDFPGLTPGWRYLDTKDAPPDLSGGVDGDIPPELARQLREAGAW